MVLVVLVLYDLSIGSTETKHIKLNTKTPIVHKKVVKFSFTKEKIFWVLVFSFMHLVSVDPMDRSFISVLFSR